MNAIRPIAEPRIIEEAFTPDQHRRLLEVVRREGDKVLLAFSPWWSDVYALACLAVLIGCSALTYRLIEAPGRDLFARLAAARPAPEPVKVADERV